MRRGVLRGARGGEWLAVLAAGALGLAEVGARAASPFSIRWHPGPDHSGRPLVEVSGAPPAALEQLEKAAWSPAQWQQLLSVHAEQGDLVADVNVPAMLGSYRVHAGLIQFEPQFSWAAGVQYRAIFRPGFLPESTGGGDPVSLAFRLPARAGAGNTVVSQVYPSGEVVPENLLKFYVHFSAPMSRGHIYSHIHLRGEEGEEVELPFLEIDEELWDPSMTRLTLIIDPGRIKRGVRPLEEVGPALETGKSFALIIDRAWPDAEGRPLRDAFQKTFRVGPPDREPLDPAQWTLSPPRVRTRSALTLRFPEPLDHALAQRVIRVTDAEERAVAGVVTLQDQERHWSFVPETPWAAGQYHVAIQTTLEDLAGNNIGKAFEVDLFEKVDRTVASATFKLPFQVR